MFYLKIIFCVIFRRIKKVSLKIFKLKTKSAKKNPAMLNFDASVKPLEGVDIVLCDGNSEECTNRKQSVEKLITILSATVIPSQLSETLKFNIAKQAKLIERVVYDVSRTNVEYCVLMKQKIIDLQNGIKQCVQMFLMNPSMAAPKPELRGWRSFYTKELRKVVVKTLYDDILSRVNIQKGHIYIVIREVMMIERDSYQRSNSQESYFSYLYDQKNDMVEKLQEIHREEKRSHDDDEEEYIDVVC